MKIEVIQCLVRLNQKGNTSLTQIIKAGPDAIPVTEVPILRYMNDITGGDGDDCCISDAILVDSIETTKGNEFSRLRQKYGRVVDIVYPGARGLPIALIDCELPSLALGKVPEPEQEQEQETAKGKAKVGA